MDTQEVTLKSGHVRLRLQTPAGRWVNVGPFGTLAGARFYAESLIEGRSVKAARVEHRNKGQWRPAWSWLVGAALLLLASSAAPAAEAGQGWIFWFNGQPTDAFETKTECLQHMRGGLQGTACILTGRCACLPAGVNQSPVSGEKEIVCDTIGDAHDVPGAGTMRRGLALALALSLGLLLTGCVSSGKVGTDIWHSLTPAERTEADVLEQAMAKLAALCHEENPKDPCLPPRVYVHGNGSSPEYGAGHIISVPRRALDPRLRPLMAHELSHAWFADARDDCQTEAKAVICERNANFHGIAVLMAGYRYDARTATKMMWALLAVEVRSHVKPSRGHPDACAELHDFERRMDAVTYYQCDELTGAAR
ncbi:MAG TPA: hypothetical protein VFS98_09485 [Methylomirabilota bacterium]|nr:hypothetical protein [Methylomirabilota bacterium]